jgi:hypothetical protein
MRSWFVVEFSQWLEFALFQSIFQDQYRKSMSCFRLDHHLASGHNQKKFLKSNTFQLPRELDSLHLTLVTPEIYSVVGGLTPLRHNRLGWVHQLGHATPCGPFQTFVYERY